MFVVHTIPDCKWCDRAKRLLRNVGAAYTERLYSTPEEKAAFKREHKTETAPLIYLNGERIGGFEDLALRLGAGVLRFEVGKNAVVPTYGSPGAAGLDLRAANDFEAHLMPGARVLVPTGLRVELPPNHYGRIAPRSGLALKAGIDVMAGVIDEDYRGDIGVVLINLGQGAFTIRPGDRIAQMIVEPYKRMVPVEASGPLDTTDRGEGGFGSTGK